MSKKVDTSSPTKETEQKPRLELIPPKANLMVGDAFAYGSEKYDDHNYLGIDKTGMSSYVGAAKRHIDKFMGGEDIDNESNIHHLAHAIASLYIVLTNMIYFPENDPRPNWEEPRGIINKDKTILR